MGHLVEMIGPTLEDEIVERAAALKPCDHATSSLFEELELNGRAVFCCTR
jgi:hypothetical protein